MVEQRELALLLQQCQVLILPVDIDQIRTDCLEHGQRHMAAIDQHHAAAPARHLPRDDQHALRIIDCLLGQQLVQPQRLILQREHRLDAQPLASRADGTRRDALPEDGTERIDQDGFAGTRLACQDVKACPKFHLDMLQQSKIPNGQ